MSGLARFRSAGSSSELAGRAKTGLGIMGGAVLVLYLVQIINALSFGWVSRTFGIRPRNPASLPDILTSPLVHDAFNWGHLLANTLPLLVFGVLAFMAGVRQFVAAVGLSWLASGIGVWLFGGYLFGPAGITVGASGVIFGLFGFLLVRGFLNRSWGQITLSVILFLVYGGILLGALPSVGRGISWQAHLFGLVGGVLAALVMRSGSGRSASRS